MTTSSTSPADAARCAQTRPMPSPRLACSTAVRVKASSVAGSVTTRFWMADSSPPENAKPPIGNIESPNCSIRARCVAVTGSAAPSSPAFMGAFPRRYAGGRADERAGGHERGPASARARGRSPDRPPHSGPRCACGSGLPHRRRVGATRAARDTGRCPRPARTRSGCPSKRCVFITEAMTLWSTVSGTNTRVPLTSAGQCWLPSACPSSTQVRIAYSGSCAASSSRWMIMTSRRLIRATTARDASASQSSTSPSRRNAPRSSDTATS